MTTKRKRPLAAERRVAMQTGVKPLRYFHRISDAEFESLKNCNKTWGWIMKHFAQPKWCTYPEALGGMMGCWSLIGRYVTGEDYCRGCDLHVAALRTRRGKAGGSR